MDVAGTIILGLRVAIKMVAHVSILWYNIVTDPFDKAALVLLSIATVKYFHYSSRMPFNFSDTSPVFYLKLYTPIFYSIFQI